MFCSEHCVLNPNHQGHCIMALQPKRQTRPSTPLPPPVTNLITSSLTDVMGEGNVCATKKRRLNRKDSDPDPKGQDVTPQELRGGQVVWGYWRDDKCWYPGLVCTAPEGGLYVQYMDGDKDYGGEFAGRDWRLDYNQDVQHNIVPTALPDGADVDFEGPQLELEPESEEVDVESESQEVEVEQVIEVESEIVPEGEINQAQLLPKENVMVYTDIWKQNVEKLGFDEDFKVQLFQKMSEVDTQRCNQIARKLCFNFRPPCKVPVIQSQIQCGIVNAEELVEMVLTNTLKDPATLDAEKESRDKYFQSRMTPESSSVTYYCGAHVTSLPDSD